ncbi:putative kinesin [Zopfia rhizophila CBS 207.26]|uniref:Putative kinesin n=1 Tax=Zopfia rhizophila CBS 207.26 TaxID=1314779 RepID=A0A6A6ENG6_9PEZI|nr:putative kinesin [Zopfia rhizophila CBS 207.26]
MIRLQKEIRESSKDGLPTLPPTLSSNYEDSPPSPSSNVPFRRDPDFVNRGFLLDQIREKCSLPASRIALVGLGGVGKSQLAIEHCYRTTDQSPETWVFWVHASSSARLKQSYQEIAEQVKLHGRKDPQADVFKLVHGWLRNERNGKWLLVLDNADDATALFAPMTDSQKAQASSDSKPAYPLSTDLPRSKNGSILVTTRTRSVASQLAEESDIILIEPMNSKGAEALLKKKLGEQVDKDYTAELVAALEYMPLAIIQAAAYIKERAPRCSVRQYLEMFHKSDKKKTSLLDYNGGHLRRDWEAKNSIIITWQISFDYILQTRRSAADLLSLMSFFDRQGIPEALIRDQSATRNNNGRLEANSEGGEESGDEDDVSEDSALEASADDGFEDDILTLRNYSFISLTTDAGIFEMHALVQLATRKWLECQGQSEGWNKKYIRILCREFPTGKYENWTKCRVLFPHARSALVQKPEGAESLKKWALLLYNAAWYAWQQGSAVDAEKMSIRSMKVREKLLGREQGDTLSSIAMVGLATKLKGRWKEAEELEVQHGQPGVDVQESRAVERGRRAICASDGDDVRVLGSEHPSTLTSMANLASTYRNQGRWKEAEELEVQVMETRKRVLGAEHPSTLTSMNNLAFTLKGQGQNDKAISLMEKCFQFQEQVLGSQHPYTTSSLKVLNEWQLEIRV